MQLSSTLGSYAPSEAMWGLALRCSKAWSSQDAEGMAACYEENGQQSINDGVPAIGRENLTAVAASYMEAFPDLQVSLDQLLVAGDACFFIWTLTGTNTGPSGTGDAVRVSGIEVWEMGESGLIASSKGYYDAEAYQQQLSNGG
ncbi:MAG: hypothetical protein ACI9J2_000532 [Saprospiraceae bacterium]|jgi:hypothetical protein